MKNRICNNFLLLKEKNGVLVAVYLNIFAGYQIVLLTDGMVGWYDQLTQEESVKNVCSVDTRRELNLIEDCHIVISISWLKCASTLRLRFYFKQNTIFHQTKLHAHIYRSLLKFTPFHSTAVCYGACVIMHDSIFS